tara:strand:+ start:499 stop:1344 length:846 start_codon:yes stop_codon:yes gene_type:complete
MEATSVQEVKARTLLDEVKDKHFRVLRLPRSNIRSGKVYRVWTFYDGTIDLYPVCNDRPILVVFWDKLTGNDRLYESQHLEFVKTVTDGQGFGLTVPVVEGLKAVGKFEDGKSIKVEYTNVSGRGYSLESLDKMQVRYQAESECKSTIINHAHRSKICMVMEVMRGDIRYSYEDGRKFGVDLNVASVGLTAGGWLYKYKGADEVIAGDDLAFGVTFGPPENPEAYCFAPNTDFKLPDDMPPTEPIKMDRIASAQEPAKFSETEPVPPVEVIEQFRRRYLPN